MALTKSKVTTDLFLLGSNISPVGFKSVMAATSNSVGVSMPHFRWKSLVELFQKWSAAKSMCC